MSEHGSQLSLSVIIPVRNGADLLRYQLEALARQDFDGEWETIVADNGSTDDLPAVIEQYAGRLPGLRRVDASCRVGVSHARNMGVGASRGDHLLFLDADDVVCQGYVEAMHQALLKSPAVAARLDPGPLNVSAQSGLAPVAQTEELNYAYGFWPWAGTGGFSVRRSDFDRIGGFDEDLLIGEDTDFCWRGHLASVTIELEPAAVVQIRHRQGAKACFRRGRFYGGAGALLYRKYRGFGMPRRGWRAVIRFYGGLATRAVTVRSRPDLEAWLFLAGYRVGLLEGCVRERVLYL